MPQLLNPWEGPWGGNRVSLDILEKKKSLALTEIWLPDYSPRSLVTIPSTLLQLHQFMICKHMQGLEVNADKTKYKVMSQDKDAGKSHSIKTDDSFERVEEFK